MAKTNLKRIKALLPAKWANTIHENTRLSKSYIYKVMDGEKENLIIVREAKNLAAKHTAELKELGLSKKCKKK